MQLNLAEFIETAEHDRNNPYVIDYLLKARNQPTLGDVLQAVDGCMFAGKTFQIDEERRLFIQAGRHVLVFSPSLDDRDAAHTVCHVNRQKEIVGPEDERSLEGKIKIPAIKVPRNNPKLIVYFTVGYILSKNNLPVVMIDEYQFFTREIVNVSKVLFRVLGLSHFVYSLNEDFERRPMGFISEIISMGECNHIRAKAICSRCGKLHAATNSVKIVEDGKIEDIGGLNKYFLYFPKYLLTERKKNFP